MTNKERDDARKEVSSEAKTEWSSSSLSACHTHTHPCIFQVGVLAQMKHPYIVSYTESFEGMFLARKIGSSGSRRPPHRALP